jgi:GNAT superfamily N-acetyltransferase
MESYRIVLAEATHLADLGAVEEAAAALFPLTILSLEKRAEVLPLAQLAEARSQGRLWVAVGPDQQAVGFALAECRGEMAFLVEIDVHPDHQKKGLGRKLIAAVIAWARTQGLRRVGLTTYASIPWNAPFYKRIGFRELQHNTPADPLCAILSDEIRRGMPDRVALELLLLGRLG